MKDSEIEEIRARDGRVMKAEESGHHIALASHDRHDLLTEIDRLKYEADLQERGVELLKATFCVEIDRLKAVRQRIVEEITVFANAETCRDTCGIACRAACRDIIAAIEETTP